MALSYEEALAELAAPKSGEPYDTRAKLMALVEQVSIECPDTGPGAATMLYSGKLTDGLSTNDLAELLADGSAGPLRVINATAAARFLCSDEFRDALLNAEGDVRQRDDFLFDAREGPWAQTSRRFVEPASGPVVTLTANAPAGRVYAQTELPALLRNDQVPTVNGLDRTLLKQAWEQANDAAQALEQVRAQVDRASKARQDGTRLRVSPTGILEAAHTGALFEGVPGVGIDLCPSAAALRSVRELSPDLFRAECERWIAKLRPLLKKPALTSRL